MCIELNLRADLNSDALVRRFVLVLVVPTSLTNRSGSRSSKSFVGQDFGELSRAAVLVLESWRAECLSTGVSEYCAFSELYPANAGLGLLTGRFLGGRLPRAEAQGYSVRPFHGQRCSPMAIRCQLPTTHRLSRITNHQLVTTDNRLLITDYFANALCCFTI